MQHHQGHIALIGAGFAGLALAFYLLSSKTLQAKVTIFHQDPLGSGASGVASGLLHPFPAGATHLSFQGFQALHEALTLIQAVNAKATQPLYTPGGIIKLALDDEDRKHFAYLGNKQQGLSYLSSEKVQKFLSMKNACSGLLIEPGYTVYCKDYIQALTRMIQSLGGKFIHQAVENLDSLKDFDHIVVCAGAGVKKFSSKTKLQFVKGQILTMEFPFKLLEKSLIGQGYIALTQNPYIYHIGSSYEHHFTHTQPDLDVAKKKILDPWQKIFPEIGQGKMISCDAGVRVMHPKNYLPCIERLNHKSWIFTALGSRGLLYHAFLAKKLAHALEKDSLVDIPQEFLA